MNKILTITIVIITLFIALCIALLVFRAFSDEERNSNLKAPVTNDAPFTAVIEV